MDDTPTAVPFEPRGRRWPWRRSLQTRIVLTYGVVFLVALLLLLFLLGRVVYKAEISAAEDALEVDAFLVANALEDPLSGFSTEFEQFARWEDERQREDHQEEDERKREDHSEEDEDPPGNSAQDSDLPLAMPLGERLQQVAGLVASDTDTRVTILTPGGVVIADSAAPPSTVSDPREHEEVQAAMSGLGGHDVRFDPATGQRMVFAAAPIRQGTQLLGIAQLARPLQVTLDRLRQTLLSLALAGLVALVVAGVLGVWLGRRLIRPIRDLEKASLAIAQGDLARRVPVESPDEIGELARAFNAMAQQVQTTVEQQRQFVANASHELRTPLTNIKLRSEALVGGGGVDTDRAQRYLVEIDSEADRLGRLASSLLDLARLESAQAGRSTPRQPVDLVALIKAVAHDLHMRAENAGLALSVEAPVALPPVVVWPEEIEAALINLVDNSIKFTPPGGAIELGARAVGAVCQVTVTDDGPGIPAEDLPHLFDRFYRVDKAHSRQSGRNTVGSGAGLGLAIAQALVEQNGGRIRVASVAGQGATFIIELPAAED